MKYFGTHLIVSHKIFIYLFVLLLRRFYNALQAGNSHAFVLLLKAASSGPRMLTWWFCTLGNNHGTSRNWESSTWQPDSELHHLKALRIGWLWHWLMSKPCVKNKWVKCVPPLDFSFSPNKRTWLAWLVFLILLDSLTRFFLFSVFFF